MPNKSRELKLFDNPRNVAWTLRGLYIYLGVLLVIDPFIHKHPEFPWEGMPNFFAVYGFVSCVLVITIAKMLRGFIKRRENYYDR